MDEHGEDIKGFLVDCFRSGEGCDARLGLLPLACVRTPAPRRQASTWLTGAASRPGSGMGKVRSGGVPMRLFKRGRVWWCWYFENGQRFFRSTKCRDQKAAELVARNWERDIADPRHAAARTATLSRALTLLLNNREEQARAGRRSFDTVSFYREKAGHLVRIFELGADGDRAPFL